MPAIGFGVLWAGYTLMFYGWCRIKGYDIGLADVVIPKHYKGKWPPPLVDDSIHGKLVPVPGHGTKATSAPSSGSGSSGSSGSGSSGSGSGSGGTFLA